MNPLPLVGVASTKRYEGANNLSDKVAPLQIVPFEDAMRNHWTTDAHFTTYQPIEPNGQVPTDDEGEPCWPRCNTPLLGKWRAHSGEIVATMLVLDFDNPAKAEWTADSYRQFLDVLVGIDVGFARDFTVFYTTLHGARLVYVLERAIPVDQAALMHKGIVRHFQDKGLLLDRACSDWTRLFRLPKVQRDGMPTEKADFFEMVEQYDMRLDPAKLVQFATGPGVGAGTAYGVIEEITTPQPTPDEAFTLLTEQNPSTGAVVKTNWYREAKRRLKNRACYPTLFELADLAESGSRDATLQRFVGEAIALLYYLDGTTPELVYALFLEAVQNLEPDQGTPDWTVNLWDKVRRIWAREKAKDGAVKDREERYTRDGMSLTGAVLEGMRLWCNAPELHGDDASATTWMGRRMIACCGAQHHILTREGQYDPIPVPRALLVPRIRELGMEPLMPIEVMRDDGKGYKQVDAQTLVNTYGTIVAETEGVVGGPHTAVIRDISSPNSCLIVRLFTRRTDLAPSFSADVDEWLRLLAGDDHYVSLCEWIGHAVAIEDGPICALSIAGPQGVGKKMLAQGLAECIDTEKFADAKEFGHFQSLLMKTPFVVVNEGFPPMSTSAPDPADAFRQLVGGDPITIDRKFRELTTIRNPCRIIFTANNRDVIHTLTGRRDLTPEDREALAIRLMHLDVDGAAAEWFRFKGGAAYTSRPGHRWIRGDSGQQSDYVVARHFLWLHGQRTPPRHGSRLLVEGSLSDDIMREMTTRTSSAPAVIEQLVKMIEGAGNEASGPSGLIIEGGRIWVLTSAIVDAHRRDIGAKTRFVLDVRRTATVLRGLQRAGTDTKVRAVGAAKREGKWYELDPGTLLAEALDHGYACKRLRQVIEASLPKKVGV